MPFGYGWDPEEHIFPTDGTEATNGCECDAHHCAREEFDVCRCALWFLCGVAPEELQDAKAALWNNNMSVTVPM